MLTMVSKFALFSNVLLTFVALAHPSPRLDPRLESPAGAASLVHYTPNWAGAVQVAGNGTFSTVTGTFIAPNPPGKSGSASIWVGIDGYPCESVILQVGVDFTITNNTVSYYPWYEWYPDDSYYFSEMTINTGDVIKTNVTAFSRTSGEVVIENLTTHQKVSKKVGSSHPLCMGNAEWIVEDFTEGDDLVPFADFGTVNFTDSIATGHDGTIYTSSGAWIVDIQQDDTVLTSVTTHGRTLTIKYV